MTPGIPEPAVVQRSGYLPLVAKAFRARSPRGAPPLAWHAATVPRRTATELRTIRIDVDVLLQMGEPSFLRMARISIDRVGHASSGADDVVASAVIDTNNVYLYELTLFAWRDGVQHAIARRADICIKQEAPYTCFLWKRSSASTRKVAHVAGGDERVGERRVVG